MEHIKFIVDDYYSEFKQNGDLIFCNIIQSNIDSSYKYHVWDDYNPIPSVPPDTSIIMDDSIVVYLFTEFHPDIKDNYRKFKKFKDTFEIHFNRILKGNSFLIEYDPPEPAYYFNKNDTIITKVDYDPSGVAIMWRLIKYYEKHLCKKDLNQME